MAARRLRAAALMLGAAVVAGVIVAAGIRGLLGDEEPGRPPGSLGLAVFLDPAEHLFGDPVTASVEVLLDPKRIDPASVRIATRFAPYSVIETSERTTEAADSLAIRYRYRLICLDEACRPKPGAAKTVRFPSVRLRFQRREGGEGLRTLPWHTLRAVSRLHAGQVSRETPRAREHPLPPVSYHIEPRLLAGLLGAAAGLLALAAVALLWRTVGPLLRRRLWFRRLAGLSPVEREIVLLRDAVARGDAVAERRALDSLARALGTNGNEELARGARWLAWSGRESEARDVLAFADEVQARAAETRQ